MRQGGAPEAISTEEESERPSSSVIPEENDGSPWLLEWFPGFDIPIGLEGRAYLRRLLNHRRAENPAACETLLAAHGIKLGRGVPGHTSNWGSMKVRELLHAAYLLGCWSAVEKLCINFCHANGLKTEWIRELKAKGGKQCVTLANLQNYRKKSREKKRPQPAESREKRTSLVATVPACAPVAANSTGCVVSAVSIVAAPAVSSRPTGGVSSFCDQVEADNGDDNSFSPAILKPSKKSRRSSAFSCDQQNPCPYVSTLLPSQQPALPESAPNSGFGYAAPISQYLSNEAQNGMPNPEMTIQQGTRDIDDTQPAVQLVLPPLQNDPEGVANTSSDNIVAAPASQAFNSASSFTYVLEGDATKSSSVTPCSSTSMTRVRRPKRRSGKPRPSGPRKRRLVSTRKSLAGDVRTDSFSSVTSSEYPAVHVSKPVVQVSTGQVQAEESKLMARSELVSVSEQQVVAINACDVTAESQSFFTTCSAQESPSRAAQRTVRTATIPAPSVARSAARVAAGLPGNAEDSRQSAPQCCHKWLTASLVCTESSDNGSSETESLHSRTSTCTTTSSNSDSDYSLYESCRCSFFKVKQVNFAGKKPAITSFQNPCPPAEVTEAPLSLFMTAPTAKEPALDLTDVSLASAWTKVAARAHGLSGLLKRDLSPARNSQHQSNSLMETMNIVVGDAVETCGSSVRAVEGGDLGAAGCWSAAPTPAAAAVTGQASQEMCTPEAFCGDVEATTRHFPPEVTPSTDFSASLYNAESEMTGSVECVSAAEREEPLTQWSLQGRRSVAGADRAVLHIDTRKMSSFIRAWKGQGQVTSEVHKHKERGHLVGLRYTHHLCSTDLSGDVRCETEEYCDRGSAEPAKHAGDCAPAPEPGLCSPFQDDQYSIIQREAVDRGENSSFSRPPQFSLYEREAEGVGGVHVSLSARQIKPPQSETDDPIERINMMSAKALSNGTHRAMLLKGGECVGETYPLQRTSSSNRGDCGPQTSDATEKDVRGDIPAIRCLRMYEGNLLSSPLPCTDTMCDTLPFGNYTQSQTQNLTGAHGLDTTSGSTEISYSTPHFPTKDTWMYYAGGRTGDYYTWGDDVGTETGSAPVASSTAPDFETPLLSPMSAALTGRSARAVAALDTEELYRASGRRTVEVCSIDDHIHSNPFPLQLPPLAETQDLFFPNDITTAEGCETQEGWRESSAACASNLGSNLTAAAEARRVATAAEASGADSTALPMGFSRTEVLSTEWGDGVVSAENCCGGKKVFHNPTETVPCAGVLEASYEIACDHSCNPTLVPGTTVHLTIRRSVAQ